MSLTSPSSGSTNTVGVLAYGIIYLSKQILYLAVLQLPGCQRIEENGLILASPPEGISSILEEGILNIIYCFGGWKLQRRLDPKIIPTNITVILKVVVNNWFLNSFICFCILKPFRFHNRECSIYYFLEQQNYIIQCFSECL